MPLNRKAQIFTWDIILATVIFLIVLGTILFLWTDTLDDIDAADTGYELTWLATAVSEQLARTPGTPYNWTLSPNIGNITVLGLASTKQIGNDTKTLDRVLDPDKVIAFINLTQRTNGYSPLRNRIFGTGKYDFYVELSCLDSNVLDCFEGLRFDNIVNYNITCNASNTTFYISNYTLSTDPSTVALWTMNDGQGTDISDSSRNSNDGTIYGAQWVNGKYGGAISFDGVDDYVQIPNSASLENITEQNYTWAAWYRPSSLPPSTANHQRHAILCKKGFHTELTYNNDSSFRFETWNTANAIFSANSSGAYPPGQWYYVAGVVNEASKNLSLYVNGQLVSSALYTGTLKDYSTMPITMGLANQAGNNFDYIANGTIDNVKILSRALAPSEVLYEYSAEKYCRFGRNVSMVNASYQIYDSKTVTFRKGRNEMLFDDDASFLEPTANLKVVVYRNA